MFPAFFLDLWKSKAFINFKAACNFHQFQILFTAETFHLISAEERSTHLEVKIFHLSEQQSDHGTVAFLLYMPLDARLSGNSAADKPLAL